MPATVEKMVNELYRSSKSHIWNRGIFRYFLFSDQVIALRQLLLKVIGSYWAGFFSPSHYSPKTV